MQQKSRSDRQGGKASKVVILTPKKGPTSVSLSAIRKVVRESMPRPRASRSNRFRDYETSVFINCPFDTTYKPLFDSVVFAAIHC